jgi:hypothetical protein
LGGGHGWLGKEATAGWEVQGRATRQMEAAAAAACIRAATKMFARKKTTEKTPSRTTICFFRSQILGTMEMIFFSPKTFLRVGKHGLFRRNI